MGNDMPMGRRGEAAFLAGVGVEVLVLICQHMSYYAQAHVNAKDLRFNLYEFVLHNGIGLAANGCHSNKFTVNSVTRNLMYGSTNVIN